MKRTDVILSAGTLAVVLLAVVVVAATGATDEFAAWAWARHHNELSWYIRVLFVLPFCYFAYKRSLWGIARSSLHTAQRFSSFVGSSSTAFASGTLYFRSSRSAGIWSLAQLKPAISASSFRTLSGTSPVPGSL
jgi:hypothetical protein